MTIVSTQPKPGAAPATANSLRSDLGVPPWVSELLARSGARLVETGSPALFVRESSHFTLVTVRKTAAASLDPAEFEAATRDAYTSIAKQLAGRAAKNPVRFWNYIPEIHKPCGDGLDRYMCFNAGRFSACSEWLGGPDAFDRLLATGSGVGHGGPDLVIHALATAQPGVAVENPRQIPAYKYSRRFGPRPPCFARATILREPGHPDRVLVGGTASIRGEESVHVGDLRAQTLETFENLASLIRSASGSDAAGLEAFRELRVYHFRDADRDAVARLVETAFPSLGRAEYHRADLCRPELSVEIEGVAELESSQI
jgi:chorismate lyase/3-hydroxybenzoate synthase